MVRKKGECGKTPRVGKKGDSKPTGKRGTGRGRNRGIGRNKKNS